MFSVPEEFDVVLHTCAVVRGRATDLTVCLAPPAARPPVFPGRSMTSHPAAFKLTHWLASRRL